MSLSLRKKLSLAHKGQVPWWKGKQLPEDMKGKNHWNWRGGLPKCFDCEKQISYISKRCHPCAVKKNSGSAHPFWKGGVTPINHKIRRSSEYRLWRESVFKRDNWTCVWCGTQSGKGKIVILHADHIKPFAYYPELRFAIDNGRTLCKECHRKTDTYGERAKLYYNTKKEKK